MVDSAKSAGFMIFLLAQIGFVSDCPPLFYLLLFATILPGIVLATVATKTFQLGSRSKLTGGTVFTTVATLPSLIVALYLLLNYNSSVDPLVIWLRSNEVNPISITSSIDFLSRNLRVCVWVILFFLYERLALGKTIKEDLLISLSGITVWPLYYTSKWFLQANHLEDHGIESQFYTTAAIVVGALVGYWFYQRLQSALTSEKT